jgi:hypothetical protein
VVVYSRGNPVWASNTNGQGSAPYKLIMQGDGNLVAYGAGGPISIFCNISKINSVGRLLNI